jgi:ribosomal protein S18 acetylase RimI-like enzyme
MPNVREFTPQRVPADFARLVPAFLEIWNAPENLKYLSLSLRPFEEPIVQGWFKDHLAAGVRYFAALGERDEILGISVLRSDPVGMHELFAVGVRPGLQRRGIGSQLVSHSLGTARSEGFACTEASVFADNVRMLRLLLSLGFVPVRIDHHRRADGADLVVLHRRLDEQSTPAAGGNSLGGHAIGEAADAPTPARGSPLKR